MQEIHSTFEADLQLVHDNAVICQQFGDSSIDAQKELSDLFSILKNCDDYLAQGGRIQDFVAQQSTVVNASNITSPLYHNEINSQFVTLPVRSDYNDAFFKTL